MTPEARKLQRRLYLVAAVILLAGLCGALIIYIAAGSGDNSLADTGNFFQLGPGESKRYTHDLELYGGKSSVLADELMRWFDGLWEGRSLAFTVAGISLFVSSMFFLTGRYLLDGLE
jgi:hypothetical protein